MCLSGHRSTEVEFDYHQAEIERLNRAAGIAV